MRSTLHAKSVNNSNHRNMCILKIYLMWKT